MTITNSDYMMSTIKNYFTCVNYNYKNTIICMNVLLDVQISAIGVKFTYSLRKQTLHRQNFNLVIYSTNRLLFELVDLVKALEIGNSKLVRLFTAHGAGIMLVYYGGIANDDLDRIAHDASKKYATKLRFC